MFATAASILWKIGADARVIEEFVQLGAKAKAAASQAMDTEAALGEIPDEFLDPIQVFVANFIVFSCFKLQFRITKPLF